MELIVYKYIFIANYIKLTIYNKKMYKTEDNSHMVDIEF